MTISKIEHGVISPPLSRLSRIAEALDTTPEDLLEEAGLSTTPARLERLASMNEEFGNSTVRQAANDALENDITTESQLLDARTQEAWTSLTAAHDRVRDEFLIPFVSVAARVQGIQDQRTVGVTLSAGDTKQERLNLQREELKRELLLAMGAHKGAAAGAGAAYSALAATAARATVSTGLAIADLSGGEASSSALATLGGSTLASGALGVPAGAALLSWMVANPALTIAEAVRQRGRKRRERDRKAELLTMRQNQTRLAEDLELFWGWAARAEAIFDHIRREAAKPLVRLEIGMERLTEDENLPEPVPFDRFSKREQVNVQELLDLASLELGVSSLPITQHLGDRIAENRAAITAWNELVLADAEQHLGLAAPDQVPDPKESAPRA